MEPRSCLMRSALSRTGPCAAIGANRGSGMFWNTMAQWSCLFSYCRGVQLKPAAWRLPQVRCGSRAVSEPGSSSTGAGRWS